MSTGEQRTKELYEAALKHPPGERASYVARIAGEDTELRSRVEALLSGQQDTVLPGYEPGSDRAEQLIATGTQIGSYRIEGPLGAGGMGVVYFATDTKLNRPAAIKVLPENLADPEARRRFQQEAQLVSSLNHPHIVTVYDAGEYEGRQYLITEYVDGGTLRQWAQRPRGWRAIVELLVGVADGIAVAHEAGILHRDIKPENILLAKNGYAKLADFGIAKLLESDPLAEDATPQRGSEHSSHLGTVAYMSPEQLQGLTLDARSDVYSFGLVVQELLAGQQIESVDPAAPRPLVPLPADVPTELRTIVAKALEQDPADRYQSMRDLVVDLRRIGRKADAAPARPAWVRAGAYILVALAVLALGVFAFDRIRDNRSDAPARNAIVVLPFANDTGDLNDVHISEGLGDDLRERLMALPGLSVQARTSSVSFRDQSVDPRTIAGRLGVGILINGRVRREGKRLDVLVEILDDRGFAVRPPLRFERQDTEVLAMQQEIAKQVGAYLVPESSAAAAAKPTTPTQQGESANMLILFGSHLEHEVKDELSVDDEKLQQAIEYYRRATVADPTSLSAHSRLAAALLYRGDVDEASPSLKTMLDLADAPKAQTTPTELSDAYYTFALYLARTRSAGMDRALQAAIRLNPNHADALGAYAQWLLTHAYLDAGASIAAEGSFREAIRLDRQSLSRYVDYAEYLGTPLERMSQLRSLALEIEERFPSARGFIKLARLYELTGDLDVGIAWGLRAYRALRQDPATPGESPASRQQLERDIDGQVAELYVRIGEFEEAARFEPELGIGQLFFRQRYGDLVAVAQESVLEHPEDQRSYLMLAFAYNATGDFASARYLLEQRLGFPRSTLTDNGTDVEVLPGAIYRDALQSLGAEAEFVRNDAASFASGFGYAVEHGFQSSWYMNIYLACAQAQLDRVGDALDSIDRIKASQGWAWLPLLEDSPCFKRVAKEQRYAALIEDLKDRQRKVRQRLPATLREYAVADVRP